MKRVMKSDEWTFSHSIYMPEDIKDGEILPLIVFLHGAGERGNDLSIIENHNSLPRFFMEKPSARAILLAPQCPSDTVWIALTRELKSFLDKFISEYPVDADRVSLTGISMGGFGTWEFSMSYPEMLSAIAPVCGGGMSWRANALIGMPIRIFHGDADTTVPITYSEIMVNKLRSIGENPEFTVYPGVAHNSWINAYEDGTLANWLASQSRRARKK